MTEYIDEEQRILTYLRDSVSRGRGCFRMKNIAEAIGLTVKQVRLRLPWLTEKSEGVEIEKCGHTRSAM